MKKFLADLCLPGISIQVRMHLALSALQENEVNIHHLKKIPRFFEPWRFEWVENDDLFGRLLFASDFNTKKEIIKHICTILQVQAKRNITEETLPTKLSHISCFYSFKLNCYSFQLLLCLPKRIYNTITRSMNQGGFCEEAVFV